MELDDFGLGNFDVEGVRRFIREALDKIPQTLDGDTDIGSKTKVHADKMSHEDIWLGTVLATYTSILVRIGLIDEENAVEGLLVTSILTATANEKREDIFNKLMTARGVH